MEKLIEMTKSHSPDLEQAVRDAFAADAIQKGTAVDGVGKEFIFAMAAVAAPSQPKLRIDYDAEITAGDQGRFSLGLSGAGNNRNCS